MTRTFVFVAAVSLALTACRANPTQEGGSKVVRPGDLVAVEGPAPVGRFYVKAGENNLDADLYELRFSPPGFDRITTQGRVSTLDGCPAKVVVAAAQREVGLTDHLQELRGDKLASVETLGLEVGSDPHVSSDCRILYVKLAEAAPSLVNEVRLFDPSTGATSSVISGETVVSAAWGPEGEIIVLKREAAGPKLLVIRTDGNQTEIDPEQPDVGNVQWGRSGWLAMDIAEPKQQPTATLFLNPATGEQSRLDGWLPLAWSPDGKQFLVSDAEKGTTLAVVEPPDFTKTRNVGASTVGTVWDAVWLPAGG
ncbi:MAG: hypothetical protein ACRD0O_03835 [Acidimicrobiia bacterium]